MRVYDPCTLICTTKQRRVKSLGTNIRTIPKNRPTNFEPKRLKPELDIVEKPENRVQGQYTREYNRERLRMWEIIHIFTHSWRRYSYT